MAWRRRSNSLYIDCPSLMKFVLYVFTATSTVFFAVLVGTSVQFLIFFKEQKVVYRLLPTKDQETLLKSLLITGFVFKVFDILHILYTQIFIDVFFVDWERPRGRVVLPGQAGAESSVNVPVSIMRTLFVANEWREIQTLKRIKPTLQIILVLFFLKVAGFEHLTTTDPISRFSVNAEKDYIGQPSFVLRFAVSSLLFIAIGIGQWIFFGFIYERFVGDAIGDFIDFCSLSNISIFLMSNSHFGYYIHGRSVHGRSDTNLKELYENFKREEDNLCGKRGLEHNSDRQTFEIALTEKFRAQYQKIIEPLRNREQTNRRGGGPPFGRPVPGESLVSSAVAFLMFSC